MRGTRVRPSPGWPGRATGTGMGRGQAGLSAKWGGPNSAGPMDRQDRAVAGLETASCGLSGAGTDGPGGWNGVLGCGRAGGALGASRDIRAHECTQGPGRVSPVLST